MPTPYQRSRTKKRRFVKLPSGRGLGVHYKTRRAKAWRCFQCGRIIFGVPAQRHIDVRKAPLSRKRPQRVFGGQLCHLCLQESLKRVARSAVSA